MFQECLHRCARDGATECPKKATERSKNTDESYDYCDLLWSQKPTVPRT